MSRWEMMVAGIALIASAWGQVSQVASRMGGLLVVTVMVDHDVIGALFACRLRDARSSSHQRTVSATRLWIRPLGRMGEVAYDDKLRSTRTFWIGWAPIWYAMMEKPISKEHPFSLSFLRGTIDLDAMISDALASEVNARRYCRHVFHYHFGTRISDAEGFERGLEAEGPEKSYNYQEKTRIGDAIGYTSRELGRDPVATGLAQLALTDDLLRLSAEMRRWLDMEEWYLTRGIPWRRGYLFDGAAGTGKTAFARAVAEDLGLPIHVFDLATLSNRDLREAWAGMAMDLPCMAVIEDIDAVFRGRDNVSPSGELTFDALLNCVDGVERSSGIVLIITTNHLDRVDPALAFRPGRIDRVVTFGPLDLDGRIKVARRIISDEARSAQVAHDAGSIPASRFVEICCRVALGDAYDDRDPYRSSPSGDS